MVLQGHDVCEKHYFSEYFIESNLSEPKNNDMTFRNIDEELSTETSGTEVMPGGISLESKRNSPTISDFFVSGSVLSRLEKASRENTIYRMTLCKFEKLFKRVVRELLLQMEETHNLEYKPANRNNSFLSVSNTSDKLYDEQKDYYSAKDSSESIMLDLLNDLKISNKSSSPCKGPNLTDSFSFIETSPSQNISKSKNNDEQKSLTSQNILSECTFASNGLYYTTCSF